MARVIYGALVTELHGSVGGTVFQGSSKGNICRNKGIQRLTSSDRQEEAKRNILYCTQFWSNTTDDVRNDYNTFASTWPQFDRKTGTRQLSGYEVFLMYNLFRLSIGALINDDIQLVGTTVPSIAPTLVSAGGVLTFNLHESVGEPDTAWGQFISRPVRAGITNPGSKLRYIRSVSTGEGNIDITAAYTALFGAIPAAGDTVFIDAKPYGILDPFVFARQRFKVLVT